MRGIVAGLVVAILMLSGCSPPVKPNADPPRPSSWVYQLDGYRDGALDEIAAAPHDLAVIDLARDGESGYFSAAEISELKTSHKQVFSYFSIGSIEKYRPEHDAVASADIMLNRWDAWPEENFVRYWSKQWWDTVVRPRIDQSLEAGFSGAYLDVPNAYEEIDLEMVPKESRESLGRKMTDLIVKSSRYAKHRDSQFMIVPQNSPELRDYSGYVGAIDGLGVEDLFYLDTDEPCTKDWCTENLDNVRALGKAGKFILAVDYALRKPHIDAACRHYAEEGFAGYVSVVELDRIKPPCR